MSEYRPLPYLGSKWRLLDAIEEAVATVSQPHRPAVCDPFAGSGVVSRRLSDSAFVVSGDVQEYSRVLTKSLLRQSSINADELVGRTGAVLKPEHEEWLSALDHWERSVFNSGDWLEAIARQVERGPLELASSRSGDWSDGELATLVQNRPEGQWTIFRNYGGVFFSFRQAAEIDLISEGARSLPPDDRDSVLAALLGSATDVVNSVGSHFAQPVRPRAKNGALKTASLARVRETRTKNVVEIFARRMQELGSLRPSIHGGEVHKASVDETLSGMVPEVGVVYADPPYTRDHYSRFYHVLETIAVGDEPGISLVGKKEAREPSRGLYREERHQSPFSVVSQAPTAFENLFSNVSGHGASLVLSYSPLPANDKPRERVMSLESILDLAQIFFNKIEVRTVKNVAHSKFNHASLNATEASDGEVLILAQK